MIQEASHSLIHKNPYAYSAHAFISALANGEWVAVFNQVMRRPIILHPPNDPQFYNLMIRSKDEGRTWNTPRVTPGYEWHGVECAGLTALRDGALLLNQWRFNWYPLETAHKLASSQEFSFPQDWAAELKSGGEVPTSDALPAEMAEYAPWARSGGAAYVHRSTDGGRTWDHTARVETAPYSGGYNMRGGVELASGEIVLPLCDVPNYKVVFVVRSNDGGRTWSAPQEAARLAGRELEEPAMLALDERRLLLMLRDNITHYLHSAVSEDSGHTWSEPRQTSILGYPAHLLRLPDGRIMCTYGYRYAPFSIRAVLSEDEGRTWDSEQCLVIRDGLPNRDLGYPATVLCRDGSLFTIYYAQDSDGVTCIWGTRFRLSG